MHIFNAPDFKNLTVTSEKIPIAWKNTGLYTGFPARRYTGKGHK